MKKWLIIFIAALWMVIAGAKVYQMKTGREAKRIAAPAATPDPTLGVPLGSALPHRNIAGTDARFGAGERNRKVRRVPRQRTEVRLGRGATGFTTTTEIAGNGDEAAEPQAQQVSFPEARAALALIGTGDEEAQAVWIAAINDPNLDEEARSDLIEDLNEEGFADEDNITAAELPIVQARLSLIRTLAPDAMDQTNAEAFGEAYRDLMNIYNRLTGSELSTELPNG